MTKKQSEQTQNELVWGGRTEFDTQGTVEQMEGKKFAKVKAPSEFQGSRIVLDMFDTSKERVYSGPFRMEYVLCNEFVVYEDFLNSINPGEGFSNLSVADQLIDKPVVLEYGLEDEQPSHKVEIVPKVSKSMLQGLIVTLPERDLKTAIDITDQIIASILDYISFRRRIPLKIHHIDVYRAETGDHRCKYLTLSYKKNVDLEEEDLLALSRTPKSLLPLLRLFREAVNSTIPAYRLLCLYRVKEGLFNTVRGENNKRAKAIRGTVQKRPKRRIPDTELARKDLPNYIGKPFNNFLDLVQELYRNNIAHLNFDEYARIFFDPSISKDQSRIDRVNTVLIGVIQLLILDEWKFMADNGLISNGSNSISIQGV